MIAENISLIFKERYIYRGDAIFKTGIDLPIIKVEV